MATWITEYVPAGDLQSKITIGAEVIPTVTKSLTAFFEIVACLEPANMRNRKIYCLQYIWINQAK